MSSKAGSGGDERPVPLAQRSRCYALEPLGRGTPYIEGVASYIDRLAEAHGVPSWIMAVKEIAPRFRRTSVVTPRGHCDLFGAMGASVHGNCATAIEMVDVMESLTGRTDLGCLTFRGFSGVLAEGRLIRTHQAWCPVCLQHWRDRKLPVYRPLIWSLRDLHRCPEHGVALETKCSSCGHLPRPVTRYPWNGHCPRCHGWLGRDDPLLDVSADTGWSRHGAEEIAKLVSAHGVDAGLASTTHFPRSIKAAADRFGWGGPSALGRIIGVYHSTVRDWADGKQVPALASVLALSFCYGVPVVDWLTRSVEFEIGEPSRSLPSQDRLRIRRRVKRWDTGELRARLVEARDKEEYPPASLAVVCRKLGIHVSQASRRVPDVAAEIIGRHRGYLRLRRETGEKFLRIVIEGAVNQLLGEGRSLSSTQMAQVLPKSVTFRDRKAWRLFLEIRDQAQREMVEALAAMSRPGQVAEVQMAHRVSP